MKRGGIAVLDLGGQYVHLIATKFRALGIYAEIRDPDDPIESFKHYKGIVLSGSPSLSAHNEDSGWSREILDLGIPILGFCFGHQEVAKYSGGEVEHTRREYGAATLHVEGNSPLFDGLEKEETVWMSHGDTVTRIAGDMVEIGTSTSGADKTQSHRYAAIADEKRKHYGLQFHPEVDDTLCGPRILKNFAVKICGADRNWSVGEQLDERAEAIRKEVGDREVLLLASGGVDSTVVAKLFERALGTSRLRLLHIDNGLMRKDESAKVVANLSSMGLGPCLTHVDASPEFLGALEGLTDPEDKRAAIGNTFIEIFERESRKLGLGDVLLGQGTIYPDTIESGGTKRAHVIKTHHNRVPMIQEMISQGKVIEPLKDLYKVEVRALGRALGLDPASIERHPFPGPGLGIRVAAATSIQKHFDEAGMLKDLERSLAGTGLKGIPLPVPSVGVKADLRSYEHPALLSGEFPGWNRLTEIAVGLAKEVAGLNRCLYLLSGPPAEKVELVPATVTKRRLDLLRQLDEIVMDALANHGLMSEIWQCPTVLVPVSLNGTGQELMVVRPIYSERAMTARPAWLGEECIKEIKSAIRGIEPISGLAIDATTKPPGTIEWE
jgi:GMP synthase (glutamine-hydrolysing)